MTVRAPLFIGSASHPEQDVRLGLSALFGRPSPAGSVTRPSGVVPGYGGSLAVTQAVSPAMSVLVAPGAVQLGGTASPTQGDYILVNDAPVTLTVQASHFSLDRVDIVIARVKDDDYGDPLANIGGYLEVVTGTPNAIRTVPAVPATAMKLYELDVIHNSAVVLTSNATDMRTWSVAVGGTLPCKSGSRPADPYPGMKIYETDTGYSLVWNGSLWRYVPFKPASSHLTRATTQTIGSGALTPVSFTVAERTTGFTVTTPITVFTIPTGLEGEYDIDYACEYAGPADGNQRVAQLLLNGNILIQDRKAPVGPAVNTLPTPLQGATHRYLAAGDQIGLSVFHDHAAGGLALFQQFHPRLTLTRVSEA